MSLTIRQNHALRSLAHALKPVVIIGQNGLTANVISEIDNALEYHELIKVRINAEDRQQRADMAAQIADTTRSEQVQLIGHIGVFFRRNPKRNRISVPKN